MKQMQKSLLALVVLLSTAQVVADCSSNNCSTGCSSVCSPCGTTTTSNVLGTPYFSIRGQHFNAARDMVGWEELINRCDMDKFYGAGAVTLEYGQSFQSGKIAGDLFGSDVTCNGDCGASLTISGSRAATRGAKDWLADYFGLPTDMIATVSFKPKIKNFVADIAFYIGLDEWLEGLYFRLDLPIAHTKWNLNARSAIVNPGTLGYATGYFSNEAVPFGDLLTDPLQFFSGASAPTIPLVASGTNVTFDKLAYGKWAPCGGCNEKTRLAAVTLVLGYNFACCEDYYFGFNIRTSAPSGNKPRGDYLFEPIVGNGGSWELGAGFDSHGVLWRSCECDSTFSFYLDANVTHLFKACQRRTFDLCGKNNSRYMLAERLTSTITPTNSLAGNTAPATVVGSTASTFQFANEFAPVANLTATTVKVSAAVQGDVALKFVFNNGNGFSWDFGYEFWARSCEKVKKTGCSSDPLSTQTWALKGDAAVYGFTDNTAFFPVALGATESLATIHAGTNGFNDSVTTTNLFAETNPGIDNARFAVDPAAGTILVVAPDDTDQTRTSIQPVLLSDSIVDYSGTKGLSNKVFTNISYAWVDHECWIPFLGIGGSAEFAQGNGACSSNCGSSISCDSSSNCCNTTATTTTTTTNCCSTGCSSSSSEGGTCRKTANSQWAVWVKGGLAFD